MRPLSLRSRTRLSGVALPTAFSSVAIRSKPLFSLLSLPSLTSLCRWRQSQRFRLLSLTSSNSTTPRTVRQTALDSWGQEYQLDVQTDLKTLNERFSDIRATNGPVQCEESLCEYLRETMNFVPKNSLEEMAGSSSLLSLPSFPSLTHLLRPIDHKYVMDVDGNAYSARFRSHLLSNQIPFKATIYEEFYADRIQPWLHYVRLSLPLLPSSP
jgi:hypothetical protein